jgi:hypothetical protein
MNIRLISSVKLTSTLELCLMIIVTDAVPSFFNLFYVVSNSSLQLLIATVAKFFHSLNESKTVSKKTLNIFDLIKRSRSRKRERFFTVNVLFKSTCRVCMIVEIRELCRC